MEFHQVVSRLWLYCTQLNRPHVMWIINQVFSFLMEMVLCGILVFVASCASSCSCYPGTKLWDVSTHPSVGLDVDFLWATLRMKHLCLLCFPLLVRQSLTLIDKVIRTSLVAKGSPGFSQLSLVEAASALRKRAPRANPPPPVAEGDISQETLERQNGSCQKVGWNWIDGWINGLWCFGCLAIGVCFLL